MHQEDEQDYAFQYWFERGYPIKRIHSKLPGMHPDYDGIDRAVREELVDLKLHPPVKITERGAK